MLVEFMQHIAKHSAHLRKQVCGSQKGVNKMGYNYKIVCKDCRKMLDLDRAAVEPQYADLTDCSKFDVEKLFPLDNISEMKYQLWHMLRALQFLYLHKFHRIGIIQEEDGDDIWEEIGQYEEEKDLVEAERA